MWWRELVKCPSACREDIIFEIGSGTTNEEIQVCSDRRPLLSCVTTKDLADVKTDYEPLKELRRNRKAQAALIVMNKDACMVDTARFSWTSSLMSPAANVLHAVSVRCACWEILERITNGEGEEDDIELLIELGDTRRPRCADLANCPIRCFRRYGISMNMKNAYQKQVLPCRRLF